MIYSTEAHNKVINTIVEKTIYTHFFHFVVYGQWRYLGANDKEKEGDYIWSNSGKSISFENWWPGEPNDKGYGGEDCMEMRYWGKWNDVGCYQDNKFICEMYVDAEIPV